MKAYLYLAKTKFLVALAYRFDVITTFLIQILFLMTTVFFWKAVYGGNGIVAGTTERQMIDYTILSLFLTSFYSTGVEHYVYSSIRQGSIAMDYIKPVNIMGMYLAMDIGIAASNLLLRFLPAFLFAAVFLGVPVPASPLALPLFLISACLGFFMMWLMSAILSLVTFWMIDYGPFLGIKEHIVGFLSGSMIPMWFFPAGFYQVLQWLPFIYMFQMPISIYIGRASVHEALSSMAIQAMWIILLFSVYQWIHKKAFRRLIVQGG